MKVSRQLTLITGRNVTCSQFYFRFGLELNLFIKLCNYLIILLNIFLCINYYFEGDLPRANPAWETSNTG